MNEQERSKLRYIANRLVELSELLDCLLAPTQDTKPPEVGPMVEKVVRLWCERNGYELVKNEQAGIFPPDTLLLDAAETDGHYLRRLRYGKRP